MTWIDSISSDGETMTIRARCAFCTTGSKCSWISAKIDSPRSPHGVSSLGRDGRAPSWGQLAAAAALVTVLGAAAWFGLSLRPSNGGAEPVAELARAASELQLAEQHYLNAIASLEQLTVRKDTTLDPAIAADIAQSLSSIDRAIADSRAALKTDPNSFVAQTSLLEALRMKVALLQETVSLMNARS